MDTIVPSGRFGDAAELWTGEFRTLGLSVAYSDLVSLVVVPVTVLHPEGYFHTGLTQQQFRIFEDGQLQQMTCFANDIRFEIHGHPGAERYYREMGWL